MEMIEGLLKLLDSYPTWAKAVALAAVIVIAALLVFSPVPPAAPAAAEQRPDTLYLKVARVELYPDDPEAEIRVQIDVNNTVTPFPSVGGVKWMHVGPDMGPKIIPLAPAALYEFRFTMDYKDGRTAGNERPLSVPVEADGKSVLPRLPKTFDYKLYAKKDGTFGSGVVGLLRLELNSTGQ